MATMLIAESAGSAHGDLAELIRRQLRTAPAVISTELISAMLPLELRALASAD